ncbi:hypothetical protein AC804_17285 [Chryseobacterium sp. Hurlbut01]|nr:hypothetical protein AC804_17285 [Chryseobacterium sp. Hurlbut01]
MKYTLIFSLLTIPLAFLVIFFGGGGHGSYLPFLILFPVGIVGIFVSEVLKTLFFILGLLQFPVYGFLLDRFQNKKTIFLISLFHLLIIFFV